MKVAVSPLSLPCIHCTTVSTVPTQPPLYPAPCHPARSRHASGRASNVTKVVQVEQCFTFSKPPREMDIGPSYYYGLMIRFIENPQLAVQQVDAALERKGLQCHKHKLWVSLKICKSGEKHI